MLPKYCLERLVSSFWEEKEDLKKIIKQIETNFWTEKVEVFVSIAINNMQLKNLENCLSPKKPLYTEAKIVPRYHMNNF